ncbi:uncharacterized protein LOC143215602 [Lasioglossum baleicum]|uniref:uncharacterized protein LOC143215602 n=1 Tax=Lasioglossum baleicum TaxID=434251 RepID=UPI003FCEA4D5
MLVSSTENQRNAYCDNGSRIRLPKSSTGDPTLYSWLQQVTQKPLGGIKNKTEKRQADQRQRESLKRRKSLPRQAESSSVNPEKSLSAPASQAPMSNDIPMTSGSGVTTSNKTSVSEEHITNGSSPSQEIQTVPRLESVQV